MSNKKRILILFVAFVFAISSFSLLNVNAAKTKKTSDGDTVTVKGSGKSKEKCESMSAQKFLNRYGVQLTQNSSDNKFTIKISQDYKNTDGEYPKFKIIQVNGKNTSEYSGKTLYYKHPIKTVSRPKANEDFEITIETSDDGDCDIVKISIGQEYNPPGGDKDADDSWFTKGKTPSSESLGIKCDGNANDYAAQNSFKERFCYAWKVGTEKAVNKSTVTVGSISENPLKCSATVLTRADADKVSGLVAREKDAGYYNVNFFKAEHTYKDAVTSEYKYHLYPKNTKNGMKMYTKKEKISCDVKCQESVKVMYMPPVASKAGFCFEYKVKVESYVNCNLVKSSLPKEPKDEKYKYKSCTPTPSCQWSSGTHSGSSGTGGPVEDYEKCVQSCDGGKYTKACSSKCFKEIYGKEQSSNTTPALNGISGKYYYWSGGSIHWHGGGPGSYYWTRSGRWGGPSSGYTSSNGSYITCKGDGFYRHDYGGGQCCPDPCWWGGCGSDKYLNTHNNEKYEGQIKQDIKDNTEAYNKLIEECEKKVSCTTSSAEFTISVEYTPAGQSEKVTVDFPYSTKKSTLRSGENQGSRDTCEKENAKMDTDQNKFNNQKLKSCEALQNANTNIIDYGGCYVSNAGKNYYMSEWSIPGTWVRNKTGEISWTKPASTKGISFEKYKFCIPLDAQDTNAKWWVYAVNKIGPTSIYEYMDENCKVEKITESTVESLVKNNKIDYNIKASTKSFGFFKWNIDINCFYGLNKTANGEKVTNDTKINTLCTPSPRNYQARSVDLGTLFPSEDGSTVAQNSTATATGRTPGFNWQADAKMPYAEFGEMATNPYELISQIQKRGGALYSDSNSKNAIDYEFNLTPAQLNEIKKLGTKYSNFNGTYKCYVKHGNNNFVISSDCTNEDNIVASIYKSSIIDSYTKVRPTDDALKCNNIKNNGARNACEVLGND